MKTPTTLLMLLCCCLLPLTVRAAEDDVPDPDTLTTLDLATARRLALAGNPSLGAARERISQARARISRAEAAWWPSLDFSAGASLMRLSENDYEEALALSPLPGAGVDRTRESYKAGLTASWLLFDGFRRQAAAAIARLDHKAGLSSLENSRRLLIQAVTAAYLNAQLGAAGIDIATADTDFYQKQLRDAEARQQAGSGRLSDVLSMRVRLNAARATLLDARREQEAALYSLAALLGLEEARLPQTVTLEPMDTDPSPATNYDIDALIAAARDNRPDIREAALRLKQIDASLKQARASFYPSLVLGSGLNAGPDDDPGLTADDLGAAVSLNLSWNLFRGRGDEARRSELLARKREATWLLRDLRTNVAAQVRRAAARLAAAAEQVELQQSNVELVTENRNLAEKEYLAGQTTLTRLNEAQRDLITTRSRLAQALAAYRLAKQELETAAGTPLPRTTETMRGTK